MHVLIKAMDSIFESLKSFFSLGSRDGLKISSNCTAFERVFLE